MFVADRSSRPMKLVGQSRYSASWILEYWIFTDCYVDVWRYIVFILFFWLFNYRMSKQAFIQDVPNPMDLPDGTPSFVDFMGSRNNRFSTPEAAAKNNILSVLQCNADLEPVCPRAIFLIWRELLWLLPLFRGASSMRVWWGIVVVGFLQIQQGRRQFDDLWASWKGHKLWYNRLKQFWSVWSIEG